ncbi:restriction endonuclease subunit S [Streptomyces cinereoruber]|uniref:restriction endonuclease subunit S n=1 Tax=Streptomyces cinereoruber TaxID=67260 RepID=UPI003628E610
MTTDSGTGPEPGGSGFEEDVTGGLPQGWARAKLGELGEWFGGGTPSKRVPEFWTDGTIPWLSPKDMGKPVLAGTQDLIHESALAASPVNLLPAGSVAIVVRSGILERKVPVAYVPFEVTLNQDMKAVVPYEGISGRWLAAVIASQERRILADCRKHGTTVASLEVSRLMEVQVLVPPYAEQLRIIAKLDNQLTHVEAGESAVQAALAASVVLRNQITGVGACGGLDGVERFPAPLEPADVDDGTLPDLPNGWRWARLGDIADVVGGVTKDSKKQSDPEYVEVPYLRVANVQRGRIVLDRVEKIRVPSKKAQSLRLEAGDVLLNEGGDRDKLGRGWIWEGQIENCIHQNHVFRARITRDVLDPRLLAWHANAFGKHWCDRNGKQTVNLASISLRRIKLMPVPIPPKSVQVDLVKSIESRLAEAEAAQQVTQGVYEQGTNLRRALLHAAFTGTLAPQDPDDEPASVFLNRIRVQRAVGAKSAKRKRAPRTTLPAAPHTSGRPVPSGTQEALPL